MNSEIALSPSFDRVDMADVLVVDENENVRSALTQIIRNRGFAASSAGTIAEARAALEARTPDIVLLDLKLPSDGLPFLEEMSILYPEVVVVAMADHASVSSAVRAMRSGASDYLTKPFTSEELIVALEEVSERHPINSERRRLQGTPYAFEAFGMLVGRTPEMQSLYSILSKIAATSHPVLIFGESGTGKETVARTIHSKGPHSAEPFIPVDCGSLAPDLIESELFGHPDGSRNGLLLAAGAGTIFLNEITESPKEFQDRLLQLLQKKEVQPTGSRRRIPLRARILAATTKDLAPLVKQGKFRRDLFRRLNVVNIRLPALWQRRDDIPLLAAYFLERSRRETGKLHTLSGEVVKIFGEYEWPGNVRELEDVIERACALCSGSVLHLKDMSAQLQQRRIQTVTTGEVSAELDPRSGIVTIAELERRAILKALRQMNGDKIATAKKLGIGKTTLYRKLKEYGL